MKLNKPSIECWKNTNNIEHIARCARLCYASNKIDGARQLYERLMQNRHFSMLRHGTFYYIFPISKKALVKKSEYICRKETKDKIYVSVNLQWANENSGIIKKWEPYKVEERNMWCSAGEECIRRTFIVTTQISTTRELNRTSPNCIAEQSTRYVDFNGKGIVISEPYWYADLSIVKKGIARLFWGIECLSYRLFSVLGLSAQDAREFLPLCAETKVAYTYSIREWKHIIDLRYHGLTGKPHPNAKLVVGLIRNELMKEGFVKYVI